MTCRTRWIALAAATIATVGSATTLLAMDVAALTKSSEVVVRGYVLKVEPRWTTDRSRIITDATIEISETWKGATGAKTLVAMQPGGEIGEIGQRVEGVASFEPGEEVVLFLEPRGDRFTVTGMAQGKFRLERSSDGKVTFARPERAGEAVLLDPVTRQPVARAERVLTVEQLKAQVRAALPTAPVEPTRPPLAPSPAPKGTTP